MVPVCCHTSKYGWAVFGGAVLAYFSTLQPYRRAGLFHQVHRSRGAAFLSLLSNLFSGKT